MADPSTQTTLQAMQLKRCGYIPGRLCMRGNNRCPMVSRPDIFKADKGQALDCPYARPGPTDRPAMHSSDIHSFLNCRIQWNFQSPLRHNLTPQETNKHLWFGKMAHFALAAYYSSSRDMTQRTGLLEAYKSEALRSLRELRDEVGYVHESLKQMALDGVRILEHYEVWANKHDNFDVVMPEVPLTFSFDTFDTVGTADGVIQDAFGDHWLLEHKTYSRVPTHEALWRSWQSRLYMYMVANNPDLAEYKIKGILYNIIHKVPPTLPKLLKSGRLTMRKNLNCSPEMYKHVLADYRARAEAGKEDLDPAQFDPKMYRNYLLDLHDRKRDYFFHRVNVTYTPGAMQRFEKQLRSLVAEMTNDPPIYPPNSVRTCPGCEFEILCDLWMGNQDWEESTEGLGFKQNTYYFDDE